MKHFVVVAALLINFSLTNAQRAAQVTRATSAPQPSRTITAQTLTQSVERSGGQLQVSVRAAKKNDSHIFEESPIAGHVFEEPPINDPGHSYLSLNSLGKSTYSPRQIMDAIKADVNRVFPWLDAKGDCGQSIKMGNTFSLGGNEVKVTDVGLFHFTFTAEPKHLLEGSATHGVFKDSTGELWLFQVGKGVPNEYQPGQVLTYVAAERMWSRMADNVRTLMDDSAAMAVKRNDNVDQIFEVRKKPVLTNIRVCTGDSIAIRADGGSDGEGITFDTLGNFGAGPDGLPYPMFAPYNQKFAARCNHGSLLLLIVKEDRDFQCICVGSSADITAEIKGELVLLVNDFDTWNNVGFFRSRVVVRRAN